MNLNFLQENWEKFAQSDPFWAVLTYSDKKGGKWKIDEFFKTGDEEIRQLMAEIGHHAKNRKRALDFGCGVGRLTQALMIILILFIQTSLFSICELAI